MRNTPAGSRGTWATFARAAREGVRFNQSELARRLGVDRTTIYRWESGRAKPENADVVQQFAEVLGIDLDEALAAAGLRPGAPILAEPTRERDEEMDLILRSRVSPDMKRVMLQRLDELRERDKQRRMEDIRFLLERGA